MKGISLTVMGFVGFFLAFGGVGALEDPNSSIIKSVIFIIIGLLILMITVNEIPNDENEEHEESMETQYREMYACCDRADHTYCSWCNNNLDNYRG